MQYSFNLHNFDFSPSSSNPGDGVSEIVLLSHQRGKKKTNKTIQSNSNKKPTKCPKFKCNTVSVSFSACRCSLVVVSSKEERKKRVWRQFCESLSEAAAQLPTAVSLLLLVALFMQISGVSLTLTWPLRLCLLRVLLGATTTATSFPLSKHTGGGDTAPASSGQRVHMGSDTSPPPVEFFSHCHFYKLSCSWLLGMCCCSCLLRLACLFTVP
jgi:hypothetical protein